MSGNFRKLDVDQYEDDLFTAEDLVDPDPRGPDGALQSARSKSGDVRNLLSRGDVGNALSTILDSPPYGMHGFDEAKAITLQSVLSILATTKASASHVQSLQPAQQDNLMKFIYKGMENPSETNPAILLAWHKEVVDVAGTGCILRVMTDRRRV